MTRLLYPKTTILSAFCLLTFLFGGHGLAQCLNVVGPTVPLYWDANSEPDIDHYNVYRSSTSGSGYSVIGTASQAPDPISFTDMTPLSTGYYVVKALNVNLLESGFSNEVCVQLSGGGANVGTQEVAVDNVTWTSGDENSFIWAHAVSGSGRLLAVAVHCDSGNKTVGGVIYAGQGLAQVTEVVHGGGKPRVEVYGLVAPPTGSNNVEVRLANGDADKCTVAAISYTGVDQNQPIDGVVTARGYDADPSVSVTSWAKVVS